MRNAALIAISLCTLGCSFDTSVPFSADGVSPDAAEGQIDGGTDAAVGEKDHLLLSEVKTTGAGVEFIEIYNPSVGTINLSDYYLADTQQYALLPGATGAGPAPDVTNNDFIARFPNGASIQSGEALVIGIRPGNFELNFGVSPDYRIGNVGNGEDMLRPFNNSIGSLASLTDSGEGVALFHWDGASDLVTDVDLVDVGPSTSGQNELPNKTGRGLDGPDPDRDESTYKTDLSTMTNIGKELEFGQSFQRLLPETDRETQTGNGNGQHGHDETTEDIRATWDTAMATPGSVAAGL